MSPVAYLGCLAGLWCPFGLSQGQPAPLGSEAPGPRQDLALLLEPERSRSLPWWRTPVRLSILNRSREDRTVVGFGGVGGPVFRLAVERLRPDASWAAVPTPLVLGSRCGCGNSRSDWQVFAKTLAPGAELMLGLFHLRGPGVEKPGRVRITGTYSFDPTPARGRTPGPPLEVPFEPFELRSAPVELVIEEPLATRSEIHRELRLSIRGRG